MRERGKLCTARDWPGKVEASFARKMSQEAVSVSLSIVVADNHDVIFCITILSHQQIYQLSTCYHKKKTKISSKVVGRCQASTVLLDIRRG